MTSELLDMRLAFRALSDDPEGDNDDVDENLGDDLNDGDDVESGDVDGAGLDDENEEEEIME